ncbi:hypothetical protein J2X26_004291 [Cellulomonas humilata]|uniref:DUF4253 domain-containing protein n=1 Tax=Cellulomonas humilata TaxID=144055 RepID=A0ABU0EKY4_9CELL|nr:hypothetical protein [Cellulomonas humilata]
MLSSTPPTTPPDDAVATARGWLALALEACVTPSAGALALCGTWDELDLTGSLGLVEPPRAGHLDATELVDRARSTLRTYVATAPAETLPPLARALDHLDEAGRLLPMESTCDGQPWR